MTVSLRTVQTRTDEPVAVCERTQFLARHASVGFRRRAFVVIRIDALGCSWGERKRKDKLGRQCCRGDLQLHPGTVSAVREARIREGEIGDWFEILVAQPNMEIFLWWLGCAVAG